jgi:hypothetical protein
MLGLRSWIGNDGDRMVEVRCGCERIVGVRLDSFEEKINRYNNVKMQCDGCGGDFFLTVQNSIYFSIEDIGAVEQREVEKRRKGMKAIYGKLDKASTTLEVLDAIDHMNEALTEGELQ